VMLNDNPMGYAYSHLICYVKFPMRIATHCVKGNTQVFTLSKNTLDAIKGTLRHDLNEE